MCVLFFLFSQENSTEVPPSPASVCSSTPEEFWRNVDYLSQVSTPDVTVSDENGMPQVFRDISSNLSGKTPLFFFLNVDDLINISIIVF